jgi:hypothetical protein
MPRKKPTTEATTKLRSRIRARSKNGFLAVREWTVNMYSARAATVASVQISDELNQSWVGPRSSISWKAPMNMVSMPKPKKSNFLGMSCLLLEMNIHTPA